MKKKRFKKLLAGLLTVAVAVSGNTSALFAQTGVAGASDSTKMVEESNTLRGAAIAKPGENVSGVKLPEGYYDRKVVGYFPNYAINAKAHDYFSIVDLQWDKLTHVQYAFVIADENTFELKVSDQENDLESKFTDREFYHKGEKIEMDESLGYYGQFNLLHTMMEKYPDVTVLASTGGWAASRSLWLVTDSEENMRKFANSAVEFVRKYGFDGIDIDFEFPSETTGSGNPGDADLSETRRKGISDRYTQLIQILRETFDAAAKEDGKYYWVTSAVSASSWVLGGQTNSDFLDYLDFVSIMSYDYHGGWNEFVENQANIYADPADTETKSMALPTLGFDWSYRYYRGKVQSEKILMGVPYYTRGWTNVSGGDGTGLHGTSRTPATGNENIWCDLDTNDKEVPAGANPLWHVMNLMEEDSNYQEVWDDVGKVPHIWNNSTKTFLTYENTRSVQERIDFVENNNLGGVLIWVMHGDYDYSEEEGKYVVGDTLTTMFHDQFEEMGAASVTSDIDLEGTPLDFSVDFGGHYDHPNYTYSIKVTNNTQTKIDDGWTLSFDLPNSAQFSGSWGGTYTTTPAANPDFTTVSITTGAGQGLEPGASVELQGMIKLNFAGVKNFKINDQPMKSAVEAEKIRLGLSDGSAVAVPVTGVSLNKDEISLQEGKTERLVATVAPSTATNKMVNWTSADATVAVVSAGGAVTAVAEGSTIITATTVDGNKVAQCTVTVTKKTEDTEDTENSGNTGSGDNSGDNEDDGDNDNTENEGGSTGTGRYPAWAEGVSYQLEDLVSYNNKVYECIYAHTSHGGWLPGATPTLWQERTDLVNTPPASDDEEDSTEEDSSGSGSTDSGNTGSGSTEGGSGSTDNEEGGSGSTDSGNTGSGSTDSGNGGSGSTDSGNSGSGSTDSGNSGSGSTDSGNSGSGSTDSGNGGSGSTDSGNGGNGSTDSGNGGSGSTDSGNGSTDSGNGGNGSTNNGNAGSDSTNNGNTGSGSTNNGNTGSGSTNNGNAGSGSTNNGNTGSGSTNNGNTGNGSANTGNNGGSTGGNGAGTQETPITTIVDGTSSVNQVTQMLTANNTEKDAAGSNYAKLSLRVSKSTKNSLQLKWNKVAGADGYVILANTCGDKLQVVKTITNGKTTSWKHTKLKKGTYYKYVVTAYKLTDGKQIAVSTSKMIHVPTTGGKYTDVKAVKVNKSKISLKKGKTAKIKAKEVKKISSKKIKRHRKLCFESDNTKVATVSKSGKIIAKSKGKCYIHVYAQNGVSKKVRVIVK